MQDSVHCTNRVVVNGEGRAALAGFCGFFAVPPEHEVTSPDERSVPKSNMLDFRLGSRAAVPVTSAGSFPGLDLRRTVPTDAHDVNRALSPPV